MHRVPRWYPREVAHPGLYVAHGVARSPNSVDLTPHSERIDMIRQDVAHSDPAQPRILFANENAVVSRATEAAVETLFRKGKLDDIIDGRLHAY